MAGRGAAATYEAPKAPELTIAEQRAITQAQLAPKPGDAPGRPQDLMFQQRMATMQRRIAHTGTQPATLVNFLPVRLMVNSSMPDLQRQIPGCTLEDKYTAYCWSQPIVEAIMSEGVRTPIDYVPRQMAEEYLREYSAEGQPGGVMIFDGDLNELAYAMEHDDKTQAEAREAQERAVVWMMQKFTEAQNWWNTPQHQMAGNITQIHRDSAARLKKLGRLGDREVEWMDIQASMNVIEIKCPVCTKPAQPGQIACMNCSHTFDVVAAFEQKLIDENSILLERLTRDQVEEMGISAYVAETSDEAPARRKKGLPRPLSRVQQQQVAEMERAKMQQQELAPN